jgi:acetate kinase
LAIQGRREVGAGKGYKVVGFEADSRAGHGQFQRRYAGRVAYQQVAYVERYGIDGATHNYASASVAETACVLNGGQ